MTTTAPRIYTSISYFERQAYITFHPDAVKCECPICGSPNAYTRDLREQDQTPIMYETICHLCEFYECVAYMTPEELEQLDAQHEAFLARQRA